MATAGSIRAGRAEVEVGADTRDAEARLAALQKSMADVGKEMQRVGAMTAGVGADIIQPLFAAAAAAGAYGDTLNDLSAKTGIATADLVTLGFAAESCGASMGSLEIGLKKMQDAIAGAINGNAQAVKSFAMLGLTTADLVNLTPDEQFRKIGDAIASLPDPAQRTAAALDVFGKSGTDMLPMLIDGAKGLKALEQHCRDLNIVVGAQAAAAIGNFDDMIGDTRAQMEALRMTIGSAIAEAILPYRKEIADALAATIQWAKENGGLIRTIAGFGLALLQIGGTVFALGKGLTVVSAAMVTFRTATVAATSASVVFSAAVPVLALAALAAAFVLATKNAANYSHAMEDAAKRKLDAGDSGRSQQLAAMMRLEQLADAQRLTSDEMGEAQGIIDQLSATYGDLGASVNATTGKLDGVAAAQRRVNEAMAQARKIELEKAIGEAERNLKTVERNLDENKKRGVDIGVKDALSSPTFGALDLIGMGRTSKAASDRADREREDMKAERGEILDTIRALQDQKTALDALDAAKLNPAALTGRDANTDRPIRVGSDEERDIVRKLDELAVHTAHLAEARAKLAGQNVKLPKLDAGEAESQAAKLEADAKRLREQKDSSPTGNRDFNKIDRERREFQAKQLERQAADIRAAANPEPAKAVAEEIRKTELAIESLKRAQIVVPTDEGKKRIEELQRKLDTLKAPPVNIPITVEGIDSAARKAKAEADALKAKLAGAVPAVTGEAAPRPGSVEDERAFVAAQDKVAKAREAARREAMSATERELEDARRNAAERIALATKILEAESKRPTSEQRVNRIDFAASEIDAARADLAKQEAAIRKAAADKEAKEANRAAHEAHDFQLDLDRQLAQARGENVKANQIEVEQYVRDQKKKIDEMKGLSGAERDRLLAGVEANAVERLNKPQRDELANVRQQVFSAAQVAAAGPSGSGAAAAVFGVKGLLDQGKQQSKQFADMIALLQAILRKPGNVFT